MRWLFPVFLFFFTVLCCSAGASPDSLRAEATNLPADTTPRIIGQILLIGNNITKEHIILRELTFRTGDTIPFAEFERALLRNEQNIYNTSLFISVHITWADTPEGVTNIFILLKERWYIFPVPIFEIVERNFNVWWQTRDFSRVVYGGVLTWNNFRGRNETVGLGVRLGYTRRLSLSYAVPYLNRKQKAGLNAGFSFSRNHRLAYTTEHDKPVYYKTVCTPGEPCPSHSIQTVAGSLEYTYRQGVYKTHYLGAAFVRSGVADTVVLLNPGFYHSNKASQQYFSLRYFFKSDHRDIAAYPLRGYYWSAEIIRNGIMSFDDLHVAYALGTVKKYMQLSPRWYASASARGRVADRNMIPYHNNQALGYSSDYVRGYEYYVTDGAHFALLKSNLKFSLLPQRQMRIPFRGTVIEKFASIPYAFYLNVYGDGAYVANNHALQGNVLSNTPLYSYGAGIDFVTYYDLVFRLEYSVNKFAESGIFLHFTAPL